MTWLGAVLALRDSLSRAVGARQIVPQVGDVIGAAREAADAEPGILMELFDGPNGVHDGNRKGDFYADIGPRLGKNSNISNRDAAPPTVG